MYMRNFYRSAHPLREIAILLPLFFVCSFGLMLLIDSLTGEISDDVGSTIAFLAFIPALVIAVKAGGQRPFRQLWQLPLNQLRDALLVCIPFSLAICLIAGFPSSWTFRIALGFCLAPVMSLAEELLFRAWMPQVIGGWVSSPLVAYLIPVPLFAAIHAPSSALGWASYLVSGLCFALLAWAGRSVAMSTVVHAVSNMTLYVVFASRETENWMLIPKSALLILASVLVVWVFRRSLRAAPAPQPARH